MKVALINEYKERFKVHLSSAGTIGNLFYLDVIDNWQRTWNVEAKDLHDIYDRSLQSKVSARLWGGTTNSPKSMMIRLLQEDEPFMRSTFRDLFNEKLDIGLRLDRFGYHADQVFRPLLTRRTQLSTHHHDDREILCLYLALQYPSKYCLFDYPSFSNMMNVLESRNIPTVVEVERYYKSCRAIYNLIVKDESLVALLKSITGRDHIDMILMSYFMEYIAKQKQ